MPEEPPKSDQQTSGGGAKQDGAEQNGNKGVSYHSSAEYISNNVDAL